MVCKTIVVNFIENHRNNLRYPRNGTGDKTSVIRYFTIDNNLNPSDPFDPDLIVSYFKLSAILNFGNGNLNDWLSCLFL